MRTTAIRITRMAAFAALVAWSAAAIAGQPGDGPPEPRRVFVPVDDWDEVIKSEPDGVLMTWQQYSELRAAAEKNLEEQAQLDGMSVPAAGLRSADYTASIDGKVLRIEAVILIDSRIGGVALVPLNLSRVAVLKASLDGRDAGIYRNPK